MNRNAICHGYEWRGEEPWKCRLPPGHKAPDGTFLGRPCQGTATLLERRGFTAQQARALAEAGYGVVGVADITQLFFGVDACNSRPVIRGGAQ